MAQVFQGPGNAHIRTRNI